MTEIPAAPDPHESPELLDLHEGEQKGERDERGELAGRGQRLLAALIDAVLTGVPSAAAGYALGLYDQALEGAVSFPDQLAAAVLGAVIYLAVNGALIYGGGQTVGKRILGIVVVGVQGNRPIDGNRYVFLRLLPIWAASVIPVLGPIVTLVDPLLIFGPARRCLHDYIAGTRVVRA